MIEPFDVTDPLVRQLVKHEGKRNKIYKDSKGISTIGVGFSLRKPGAKEILASVGADIDAIRNGEPISNFQMQELLRLDIEEATKQTKNAYKHWNEISNTRQRALIEMTFNLGVAGLHGFERMNKAIALNDWDTAADEAMDSKWYREDVAKVRGDAIVSMLRHGPAAEAPPIPSPNPLREENEFANRPVS